MQDSCDDGTLVGLLSVTEDLFENTFSRKTLMQKLKIKKMGEPAQIYSTSRL
jgi:hypothetical protein